MKNNDVVKYEFIGEKLKVVDSKNKDVIGVKGKIIDETKNMFMLDNGKKIIKDQSVLEISIGEKKFMISGKILVGRPEDRLKRRIK